MSPQPPARACRHIGHALLALLGLLLLSSCSAISGALPPSPSPFPTLARLPTVTPFAPTPPAGPTVSALVPPSPTPPAVLAAAVAVDANVRAGPGTTFAIVGVAAVGERVMLHGQSDGWFRIETRGGVKGWMFGQVLEVAPEVAAAVPLIEP